MKPVEGDDENGLLFYTPRPTGENLNEAVMSILNNSSKKNIMNINPPGKRFYVSISDEKFFYYKFTIIVIIRLQFFLLRGKVLSFSEKNCYQGIKSD